MLSEAAVKETGGKLRREEVAAALDHAVLKEGPGGGAEMVPGHYHAKMNIYIAAICKIDAGTTFRSYRQRQSHYGRSEGVLTAAPAATGNETQIIDLDPQATACKGGDRRLQSPRIKRDVASRFWPPRAIVEEDTCEQRQQQRAACHNKAHAHAT